MPRISSFVISIADYLSLSFSAKNISIKNFGKNEFGLKFDAFEIVALTSGDDIVIPKLIGSNSESSLSKPLLELDLSVINVKIFF